MMTSLTTRTDVAPAPSRGLINISARLNVAESPMGPGSDGRDDAASAARQRQDDDTHEAGSQ
jgi:hypothetical protein